MSIKRFAMLASGGVAATFLLATAGNAQVVPAASTVTVLSPIAILEPCTTGPCDKDGYPPTSSSADPEEGTLGVKLVVASTVVSPRVVITDASVDAIDDVTINDVGATAAGVTRDVDYLDGVLDGQIAPGTYFLYFNLDKTNYDVKLPSSSATLSVKGDSEKYTVSLQGSNITAITTAFTVKMEGSASIDQNDLRWLETAPSSIRAAVGDTFTIRTRYSHQSAGALDHMILQSYYQGRALRLEQVNLYYYNTNGADIGSVATGVPAGWNLQYRDKPHLPRADQPATLSSGDRWVGEFTFKVIGRGGSRFVPYFQTKPSRTANWKIDTGYQNFQVEPPGQINPAVLNIQKSFGATKVVSGPEPPLVGSTTTYDLVLAVSNTGLDNAINTVVTDPIPSGVTFAGNFVASQGAATFDAATAKITWTVGTLAQDPDGSGPLTGGAATLHFRVSVTPTLAQVGTQILLNNGALTTGNSQSSGLAISAGPSNALSTTAAIAGTRGLSISKTVNTATAVPGGLLTYTLTYRNIGNLTETNVVISDALPARTTFVSASNGGVFANGGVTWSLGSLAAGATGALSFTVKLDALFPSGTTPVTNVGTIRSDAIAPTSSNQAQTAVTASPTLGVTKAVNKTTALPGDSLTYTLTYTNTGNANATGVVISDPLPARTTFLSASPGGTFANGTVTWAIGGVAVGASGLVSVTVKLDATFPSGSTSVTNTASIGGDGVAPVTSPPVTTTVAASPTLTITKTIVNPTRQAISVSNTASVSSVETGQLAPVAPVMTTDSRLSGVTYRIVVGNTGNADATQVAVTDQLPAGIDFVSATGGGSFDTNTRKVTWSIASLATGATQSFDLVVSVQ